MRLRLLSLIGGAWTGRVGLLECDVQKDPPWPRNESRWGPLSRHHLVNAVVAHSDPRAMHTCASPCPGGLGFGSERRIWSGFEYAIGLAWGVAYVRSGQGGLERAV